MEQISITDCSKMMLSNYKIHPKSIRNYPRTMNNISAKWNKSNETPLNLNNPNKSINKRQNNSYSANRTRIIYRYNQKQFINVKSRLTTTPHKNRNMQDYLDQTFSAFNTKLGTTSKTFASENSDEINELKEKLKKRDAELAKTRSELRKLRKEMDKLKAVNEKLKDILKNIELSTMTEDSKAEEEKLFITSELKANINDINSIEIEKKSQKKVTIKKTTSNIISKIGIL